MFSQLSCGLNMMLRGLNTPSHVSIYSSASLPGNFRMKSNSENGPIPSFCLARVVVLSGQLHLAASSQTVRRRLELQMGDCPYLALVTWTPILRFAWQMLSTLPSSNLVFPDWFGRWVTQATPLALITFLVRVLLCILLYSAQHLITWWPSQYEQ